MKIQIQYLLGISFYFFTITICFSQSGGDNDYVPNVIPPSPSSQAFQIFGDYPVDYSTGIPDISIPIYEINTGKLKLPIVLRYHVANVKPSFSNDYYSPEVGLGWVLDIGGEISRTIYGSPDEGIPHLEDATFFESNDYGGIDQTDYQSFSKLVDCLTGKIDSEYDIFNYSFPGQNGKFIMVKNNINNYEAHLLSFKPYQFDFIINNPPQLKPNLETIKLTDDGGNIFTYGEGNVEESQPIPDIYAQSGISTWKLKQIKSSNLSDIINFSYVSKPEYWLNPYNNTFSMGNDYLQVLAGLGYRDFVQQYPITTPTSNDFTCQYSSSEIKYKEVIIKQINFNNGHVDFELSSDNRSIKSVSVFNHNELIKKTQFYQSNHHLDSIRIYDKNETDYKTYRFDYNNSNGQIGNNPNKVDYWGYYNGSTGGCAVRTYNYEEYNSSTALPPLRTLSYTVPSGGGGSAEPNANKMKSEILEKIHYPTGGETEFIYEPNMYESNIDNELVYTSEDLSGGLRIRSIINRPNSGEEILKRYKYGENDVVNIRTSDWRFFATTNFTLAYTDYGQIHNVISTRTRYFGNTLSGELIDNARYKKVVEIQGANESNCAGKTVFYYNYDSRYRNSYSSYGSKIPGHQGRILPNSIVSLGNGDLYKKEYLKRKLDGTFSKEMKEEFEYQVELDPIEYKSLRGFQLTKVVRNSSPTAALTIEDQHYVLEQEIKLDNTLQDDLSYGIGVLLYNYDIVGHRVYNIRTGKKQLKTKISTSYYNDEADYLVETTNYFYNTKNAVSKIEKAINNNSVIQTEYKYPYDLFSESCMNELIAENKIATPLETITNKDNIQITRQKTTYKCGNNELTLPEFVYSKKGTGGINTSEDKKITYDKYEYGNILQYTIANGTPTCIIWGYNNEYPIAKIENATYSQVLSQVANLQALSNSDDDRCLDSGTCDEKNLRTALAALRTSLPNAMVTTYTYDPLIGVTSITDPKSQTVYYEYDDFNRLEQVIDTSGNILSENQYNYKQ